MLRKMWACLSAVIPTITGVKGSMADYYARPMDPRSY